MYYGDAKESLEQAFAIDRLKRTAEELKKALPFGGAFFVCMLLPMTCLRGALREVTVNAYKDLCYENQSSPFRVAFSL